MQSLLLLPLSLLLLGFLVPLRKELLQQRRELLVRLGRVAMDPELYVRGAVRQSRHVYLRGGFSNATHVLLEVVVTGKELLAGRPLALEGCKRTVRRNKTASACRIGHRNPV